MSIHFRCTRQTRHFAQSKSLETIPTSPSPQSASNADGGNGRWCRPRLYAFESAVDAFPRATHFLHAVGRLHGRSSLRVHTQFLDENDADFIESFDYFRKRLDQDRHEGRAADLPPLLQRAHAQVLFYICSHAKTLGANATFPQTCKIMIGSQWWCLRRRHGRSGSLISRATQRCDAVFPHHMDSRRDVLSRPSCAILCPRNEIEPRTLTFLMFTDYGMPVTFYNDHYDLVAQSGFPVRAQNQPEATDLQARLGVLMRSRTGVLQISNEGRKPVQVPARAGPDRAPFCHAVLGDEAPWARTRVDDRGLQEMACGQACAERIRQGTNVPALSIFSTKKILRCLILAASNAHCPNAIATDEL